MGVFKNYVLAVSPPWLRRKWGRRWAGVIGDVFDALGTSVLDATRVRFLKYAPIDSYGEHADTRQIERALGESNATFAERLRRAFYAHRLAATRRGMQEQYAAGGYDVEVMQDHDWYFDPPLADGSREWWRYWPVVRQPHGLDTGPGWDKWGDPGAWGDGTPWPSLGSPEKFAFLRRVAKTWQGAHNICHSIIVILSGGLWGVPTGTWGDGTTWGGEAAVITPS